jgi:hypothetical protein
LVRSVLEIQSMEGLTMSLFISIPISAATAF